MQSDEIFAISSLSGARLGIDGLVQLPLFFLLVMIAIKILGRHEYSPSGVGIFGVAAISLISAAVGGLVGQGASSLSLSLISCGLATLFTSGPFLDFRLPHRLVLSVTIPLLLFLSWMVGGLVESYVVENALK